jgi:hypothetical protein
LFTHAFYGVTVQPCQELRCSVVGILNFSLFDIVYKLNITNKLFFSKPDGMPVVNVISHAGEILRSKPVLDGF